MSYERGRPSQLQKGAYRGRKVVHELQTSASSYESTLTCSDLPPLILQNILLIAELPQKDTSVTIYYWQVRFARRPTGFSPLRQRDTLDR